MNHKFEKEKFTLFIQSLTTTLQRFVFGFWWLRALLEIILFDLETLKENFDLLLLSRKMMKK